MKGFVLGALCVLFFAPALGAEEWVDFSSRAQGQGGAGALFARGGTAAYYNPANAARRPWEKDGAFHIEFDIPASFSAAVHGESFRFIFDTVELANDLFDRFQDGAFDAGTNSITFEDFRFAIKVFDALDRLNGLNGEGLYVGTGTGLGVRFSGLLLPRDGFGIYVGGFGIGAFSPVVDLESLRGYRLTDESGAQFEQLVTLAIANSGQPAPAPQTPGGQAFSAQLQAGGYSQQSADALAAQAEAAGINFGGAGAGILLDFLLNTLNGTGTSLEGGANPLEGNNSGFLIRGLSWYEIGLTYSFGLPILGAADWLALGATVKFIQAYAFSQLLRVQDMNEDGVEDTINRLRDDLRQAYAFEADAERFNVGLDLGLVFTPQVPGLDTLAVSLTARNVNGPEFRWDGGYYKAPKLVRFDPQFRLGAGYTLFAKAGLPLSFGFEIDLNRVSSDVLPNYHTQFVRAGVSFEPDFGLFGFAVRAGMLQNIADAGQATTFTAGLGLRIAFFRLDFAGMLAVDTNNFGTSLDFDPLPQRFGGSVQLAVDLRF
ncbi:MAG: conjugal transfer protein TraF [Planctomycetes bacterium]|jgi:hypothetical protein|nr:conjugal transfer protein TraF [Planctomycetota bacterium]MCL4731420.1 conjugal transfer protein TraF [Planctomycetota bacterium]